MIVRHWKWTFVLAILTSACADSDQDGFLSGRDCDDASSQVYPGAPELCDGIDNDCDGSVDEDDQLFTFWRDADGDGYGEGDTQVVDCAPPRGFVDNNDDCDDTRADIHPGRSEQCNGVDDDCDDEIDEADAYGGTTWYADLDEDGFGDPEAAVEACQQPSGHVGEAGDCDDASASVFPGADERCNGVDDDCDEVIDEPEAVDALAWHADLDGDGFGDPDALRHACTAPPDHVADAMDCDDAVSTTFPGADELCNDVDDDCDEEVDELAIDRASWFPDGDGDGHGDEDAAVLACDAPTDHIATGGDCDDGDAAISPDAVEVCGGVDEDCDGLLDVGAIDQTFWAADADDDGFGDPVQGTWACDMPTLHADNDDDCDDGDGAVNPDATEVCDTVDNDCDGEADEADAALAPTWYADLDGDLVGDDDVTVVACVAPADHVAIGGDCDDAVSTTHAGAPELCNDVDDDCDEEVDELATDRTSWFPDEDEDGYGAATGSLLACDAPAGFVDNDEDCDDADPDRNPTTTWYFDADQDGYGIAGVTATACLAPSASYALEDGDCRASDASSHPGAEEICTLGNVPEGIDNDCDGEIDEDCPQTHCGTISTDETWSADVAHEVTCDVYVQGSGQPTLTIEAGATVRFAPDAGLYVGDTSWGGLITGPGAITTLLPDEGDPDPGHWDGVVLGAKALEGTRLDDLEIGFAQYGVDHQSTIDLVSSGLQVHDSEHSGVKVSTGTLALTDCELRDNGSYGLELFDEGALSELLTDCTLTGNDTPVRIDSMNLHMLDASTGYTGNDHDHIEVEHDGFVTGDVTWKGLDVPYHFTSHLYLGDASGTATVVTIEDGAELQFDTARGVYVGDGTQVAELVVQGDPAGEGVRFVPHDGVTSWYGIVVSGVGTVDLAGFTLRHGGGGFSHPAGITGQYGASITLSDCTLDGNQRHGVRVVGTSTTPSSLSITDCTIENTATSNPSTLPDGDGIRVASDNVDLSLSGVTITGSDRYPIMVPVGAVAGLPSSVDGSDFTGNGTDVVRVEGGTLSEDATWEDPGVPLQIGSHVYVYGTNDPVLTIEDAELQFEQGIGMSVANYSGGSLVADAVTFTSAQAVPAAGDWCGILVGNGGSATTKLVDVVIEYGGATTGCFSHQASDANLMVSGGAVDLTSSGFHDSADYGIACSASASATMTGNSFSGNVSGDNDGC